MYNGARLNLGKWCCPSEEYMLETYCLLMLESVTITVPLIKMLKTVDENMPNLLSWVISLSFLPCVRTFKLHVIWD